MFLSKLPTKQDSKSPCSLLSRYTGKSWISKFSPNGLNLNLLSSTNILKDEEKHFYEEQYIQPSKFRCYVRRQKNAGAISEFFSLPRQYAGKKNCRSLSRNLCILNQQWLWHTSAFSQGLWFISTLENHLSSRQLPRFFAEANSVFIVITSAKIFPRWLFPSKNIFLILISRQNYGLQTEISLAHATEVSVCATRSQINNICLGVCPSSFSSLTW